MSRLVITDGDMLKFDPAFGNRVVTVPGTPTFKASGEATIRGKAVGIAGDEQNVSVDATYTAGAYTGGTGILTISQLNNDQLVPFFTSATAIIVAGSQFIARFTPSKPAQNPDGVPDVATPTTGSGQFITQQPFVTAG